MTWMTLTIKITGHSILSAKLRRYLLIEATITMQGSEPKWLTNYALNVTPLMKKPLPQKTHVLSIVVECQLSTPILYREN